MSLKICTKLFLQIKIFLKLLRKVTASKTGTGEATSDDVMDKTVTKEDKPAGQTDAKDLKSWRSDYETSEGKTWNNALKGNASDRRAYSLGFANYLKDKAVTDTGFDYTNVSKLYPSNYLDTKSYNNYNAIVDSYHLLGLPFERQVARRPAATGVVDTKISSSDIGSTGKQQEPNLVTPLEETKQPVSFKDALKVDTDKQVKQAAKPDLLAQGYSDVDFTEYKKTRV